MGKNDSVKSSKRDSRVFRSNSGSGSGDLKVKHKTFPLWPEFSDADINAEKWEIPRTNVKGKSPSTPSTSPLFEDPEGRVEMPSNMQICSWQRLPPELSASKPFVVVENEDDFDLINYSKHLCSYPLMRMIMSQITLLWNMDCFKKPHKAVNSHKSEKPARLSSPSEADDGRWKPWEHIYSMCKAGKGHMPLHNPTGKYVVRLYYLGCWRKVVVDDFMPYDNKGQLMLPTSAQKNEIWPMILAKALIKVASVSYHTALNSNQLQLSEFSVIHSLTGWIPEVAPLCPIKDTWDFLKRILPDWKYPSDAAKEEECVTEAEEGNLLTAGGGGLPVPNNNGNSTPAAAGKSDPKAQASSRKLGKEDGAGSGKNSKDGNRKGKQLNESRERHKSDSEKSGDEFAYAHPEYAVFATFDQTCPTPAPLSEIKNMADGSEVLRNMGLSQIMAHPILVKKTRSLPLIPEPEPVPIPRWKLIRPRAKPCDPNEKKAKKPDQWLELSSPFLNVPRNPQKSERMRKYNTNLRGVDEFDEDEPSADLDDSNDLEDSHDNSMESSAASNNDEQAAKGLRPSGGSAKERRGELSGKVKSNLSTKSQLDPASRKSGGDSSKSNRDSDRSKDTTHLNNEYSISDDADAFIKSAWVDFDDFCKTFKNLIIFHKPNTYRYNASTSEFKPAIMSGSFSSSPSAVPGQNSTGKKNSMAPSNTNVNSGKHGSTTASMLATNAEQAANSAKVHEERQVHTFLMVDTLRPSELLLSLSSLSYWPGVDVKYLARKDAQLESVPEEYRKKSAESGKGDQQAASKFIGRVVVEPYQWVDCKLHQPILNIKTNGVYGTCLLLPPGRNVLRLNTTWNYAHNLHVCSTTPFTYGTEDQVMIPLKEESERFKRVAGEVMKKVEALTRAMGKPDEWKEAMGELRRAYNPSDQSQHDEAHHQAFLAGLRDVMWHVLGESGLKQHEVNHLFYALTLDFTFLSTVSPSTTSFYNNSQNDLKNRAEEEAAQEREEEEEEEEGGGVGADVERANVVIQKHLRGFIVRKIIEDHGRRSLRDQGPMHQFRLALKASPVQHGSFLLRRMFKYAPQLINKYDFSADESKKVCFNEYNGEYSEQHANQWFVVFRGVFHTEEDCWCVPVLYGMSAKCLLHVVDNDTGEEVRRIFNRPVPHLYTKNQNGYTFAAELKTFERPIPAGKWKMKLIGPEPPSLLPVPASPTAAPVDCTFATKDIHGFYVPNPQQVVFRYVIQCKVSQLASIQVETSCKNVEFLLEIINKGKVVCSRQGRGHMFLPYCYFVGKTNPKSDADTASTAGGGKESTKKGGKSSKAANRAHSPKEDKKKEKLRSTSFENEEEVENRLYYVQMKVLNHSWKLNEQQLVEVEKLRELEREEMKLDNEDSMERSTEKSTASNKGSRKSTNSRKSKDKGDKKDGSASGGKDGAACGNTNSESVTLSSNSETCMDERKAYWRMRVVCEVERVDDMDVRKDRTRLKEIKAMKQAWEALEEGRSSRAKESRQRYLEATRPKQPQHQTSVSSEYSGSVAIEEATDTTNNNNNMEENNEADEPDEEGADSGSESGDKPQPKRRPIMSFAESEAEPEPLTTVGVVCPFTKSQKRECVFYDADELKEAEMERQRRLTEEENRRQDECDELAEANLRLRTALKEKLMEECQQLQLQTDMYRTRLLKPRNLYRQSLIDDLKFEQEKAAALAAQQAGGPDSGKTSGKDSKGKKKKK